MTTITADYGVLATGAKQRTAEWGLGLRNAWSRYRAYRTTLEELRSLTEKQLGDAGLRRDALKATARAAVDGK